MSAQVLRHSLEVLRVSLASPAGVDEWNQPVYTSDAVVATVAAQIQPLSMTEVVALSDAGAQVGDYRAFMLPTDVRTSDRIRRVDTDETFEVRSVIDAAGVGHHLELLLHRVVD